MIIPKQHGPMVKDNEMEAKHGDLHGVKAMQKYSYGNDNYPASCLWFQGTLFVDGVGYSCSSFEEGEICSVCCECKISNFFKVITDL